MSGTPYYVNLPESLSGVLDRRGAERVAGVERARVAYSAAHQTREAAEYRKAQTDAGRAFQEEQAAFVVVCEIMEVDPARFRYDVDARTLVMLDDDNQAADTPEATPAAPDAAPSPL